MNAVAEISPVAKKKEPTVVDVIQMSDGRKVEFAGKRKLVKTGLIPGQDGYQGDPGVQLDFRNGQTIKFIIPESLFTQFAVHGASQKLGDETAGKDDPDDMFLEVEALVEQLNNGEWGVKRESSGGFAGTSVLLRAMVEVTGKPIEKVKEFLKTKTQAEKMALRGLPKFKPVVERLEAEKAAKSAKVDTSELENQIEGL